MFLVELNLIFRGIEFSCCEFFYKMGNYLPQQGLNYWGFKKLNIGFSCLPNQTFFKANLFLGLATMFLH